MDPNRKQFPDQLTIHPCVGYYVGEVLFMDIRCPVSSSNSREEKKKKPKKEKKGSKSALHSGGMGVPKKGISEKGQNSGSGVGNPARGCPEESRFSGAPCGRPILGGIPPPLRRM